MQKKKRKRKEKKRKKRKNKVKKITKKIRGILMENQKEKPMKICGVTSCNWK